MRTPARAVVWLCCTCQLFVIRAALAEDVALGVETFLDLDWPPATTLVVGVPAVQAQPTLVRVAWFGVRTEVSTNGRPRAHPIVSFGADYLYIPRGVDTQITLQSDVAHRPDGRLQLSRTPLGGEYLAAAALAETYEQAGRAWQKGGRAGRARADELYTLAARLSQNTTNRDMQLWRADILHALAEVAFYRGDAAVAVANYRAARDQFLALGEPLAAAAAENSLGLWFIERGEYASAGSALNAASDRVGPAALPTLSLMIKQNQCRLLLETRQLDEAEACLRASIAAAETDNFPSVRQRGLNDLGGVYSSRGQPFDAVPIFKELAGAVDPAVQTGFAASVNNNLALQYRQLGYPELALQHYLKALEIDTGAATKRALILANIGQAYFSLGDSDRAATYFQRSLALHVEAGDIAGIDESRLKLARIALEAGRSTEALKAYQEIIQNAETGNRPFVAYRAQQGAAAVLTQLGQLNAAMDALDRADRTARRFDLGLADRGQTELQRSRIFLQLGDIDTALTWANKALATQKAAQFPAGIVLALETAGEAQMLAGELEAATRSAREALTLVSRIRGRLANLDLRHQFGNRQFRAHALLAEVLMRRHAEQPAQGYDRQAFIAAESSRAKSLGELLGAEADERLVDTELGRERVRLTRQISEFADSSALNKEDLAQTLLKLDAIDNQIAAANPRSAILDQRAPLTVTAIQKILRSDEVLLHYLFTPWGNYVWSVTEAGFQVHVLILDEAYRETARRAIDNLRAGGRSDGALARLSQQLVSPVAADLGRKSRVLLVADGALNFLPIDAFPMDESDALLLDTHVVTYLPSAATLAFMRRESGPAGKDTMNIVALADPVFNREDPRIKPGGDASDARAPLNRLPLGASEVREIATILPETRQPALYLGSEANRTMLLNRDWSDVDVLHIASHGVANADRPELSGLTLSRFGRDGEPLTGFVGLRDIYRLQLRTRLVVLSACETGLGASLGSEGVVGLSRAFLFAGSREVVASLWQVQDRSTAQLMAEFYRQMLENGLDTPSALRAAKQAIRQDRRWRHPYFWAGFTIQGDFRPR